jgi:hypothetical protein
MTNLQSIALPSNENSLAYVQVVLRHNFSPSKVADLVNSLKSMQSEIRACLEKLESSFRHVHDLYIISNNRLERVATSTSIVSTSTMLTARIKLAGWLKRRERIWRLSSRSASSKVRLYQRDSVSLSQFDFQFGGSLDTDYLLRIPTGVLSKILSHLCGDGPLTLRHLLFVSKGLYYAAVNDAALWTTISFEAEFFSHFRGRPVMLATSFTEQCLRCSSSRPLCIRILWDDAPDAELLLGPLQALRNPEYRVSGRCTSLTCYHNGFSKRTREIVALLPKEFPCLQHLSLLLFKDPTDGSEFPNCPVLESVEMVAHNMSYPAFWGTNFAHVTTLSFGNTHPFTWAPFDIVTLSLFPVLRDLTLTTIGTSTLNEREFQPSAQFQYLKIFRVCGYIPSMILTNLVAPALEELYIKANTKHLTSISVMSYSFEPLCQHLYAHLPEAISAEEPHWATALTKLVERCSRLETLYISKWMEEECQKFIDRSKVVLHVL